MIKLYFEAACATDIHNHLRQMACSGKDRRNTSVGFQMSVYHDRMY